MIPRFLKLNNGSINLFNSSIKSFYSTNLKNEHLEFEMLNTEIRKPSKPIYIGPKEYNLDSYLLKNKFLDNGYLTQTDKELEKCWNKETNFFLKNIPDSVNNECPYDKLKTTHEFYLNETLRGHKSIDIRRFEYMVKEEEKLQKKIMKKLAKKLLKKASKETTEENEKEEKSANLTEAESTEQTKQVSNEFKLDDEAIKIVEKNKTIKKNNIKSVEEKSELDLERLKYRKLLIQEDLDDRNKKLIRHAKFLKNYNLNKGFFVDRLVSVPLVSKEMLNESSEFYNQDEISAAKTLLFSSLDTNKDIYSDRYIPSVSNIIQIANPLTEGLLKWKLEKVMSLGLDGLRAYLNQIKQDGEKFHSYVENKLHKKDAVLFDENLLKLDAIFKDIDQVLLTEAPVLHSNLFYQGRIDCLAYYQEELCLIDWKFSEKSKPEIKDLYEQPAQISAYIGAFFNDPRYEHIRKEHTIKKGLLINFNKTNGEIDIHKINYQLAEFYWYKWLSFVKEFWINVNQNQLKSNEELEK